LYVHSPSFEISRPGCICGRRRFIGRLSLIIKIPIVFLSFLKECLGDITIRVWEAQKDKCLGDLVVNIEGAEQGDIDDWFTLGNEPLIEKTKDKNANKPPGEIRLRIRFEIGTTQQQYPASSSSDPDASLKVVKVGAGLLKLGNSVGLF
jgi:hypothetical protein